MQFCRFILVFLCLAVSGYSQTSPSTLRDWRDQQGRTIRAAFVKMDGDNVILKLENGSEANVQLSRFSAEDQAFARQQTSAPGGQASSPASASQDLTWPAQFTVDKSTLKITNGEQTPSTRTFVYQSGVFQFISQAPLTGTVMRDIASDFELTSRLFTQLPWGWEPKPRKGAPYFVAKLLETEEDYITAGGSENSSGGAVGDVMITKFQTLGLKKVGEKYAFNAKLAEGGEMIALIARLLIADMRPLTMPWSGIGLEQFLQRGAYRNGSFSFTSPERAVKEWLDIRRKGGSAYELSIDRLVKRIRTPWSAIPRNASTPIRIQNHMDDFMLVYYFGFLDGDGKGTNLHRYYSAVAKDSIDFRNYNEGGRKTRLSWRGTFEERAMELLTQYIIRDQTDEQLRDAISTKFKSVGIRF